MHRIVAATWLTVALLLGPGTAGAETPAGPVVEVLPATLDGTLEIDVPPGDDADDGGTVAFGVFNSDGNDYTVELTAELYAKAPDGGPVRITLGSVRHNLGFPVYLVTALERL
jgi:hypothetical protein